MSRTPISNDSGEKRMIYRSGRLASFSEIITSWREDATFREFFIRELAETPFPAYFWEMPPIRRDTVDRDFEYVVIRSDALARMPVDADAFDSIFKYARDLIISFRNLGGDALLVAPRPVIEMTSYAHMAIFLREAPDAQRHELFITLADAIYAELRHNPAPVWVSTAGLGVAWLHVRLDSYPKYYQYRPYAEDRG